jgi:hypothetical protein
MSQTPFLLKAGVIAGAVLLGGGFVYVRAGGQLPGVSQAETVPLPQGNTIRTILPGSKSAAVAPLIAPNAAASQSTTPVALQPSGPAPTGKPVAQSASRTVIMSGSKSLSPVFSPPTNAQQPSPLEALPAAPAPQPSPLEALKKPSRQRRGPAIDRSAPTQQIAPQR